MAHQKFTNLLQQLTLNIFVTSLKKKQKNKVNLQIESAKKFKTFQQLKAGFQ